MIGWFSSEQNFDATRSMNDQLALAARGAAEQLMRNGQEAQAQIAAQILAARERFVSCLDEMAGCNDAAAASQAGATFMMDSLRAFGDGMTEWNRFVVRNCRNGLAPGNPSHAG